MDQKARYSSDQFYFLCDTVRVGKLRTGGHKSNGFFFNVSSESKNIRRPRDASLFGRSVKTKTDKGGCQEMKGLG